MTGLSSDDLRVEPRRDVIRVLWWNLDWQHAGQNAAQIAAVLAREPAADVIGLCEVNAFRGEAWRKVLEGRGYHFGADPPDLPRRWLRVLLAALDVAAEPPVERFAGLRPQSHSSLAVKVGDGSVEVHATHVPHGSSNGWAKIDHLEGLRQGLEPPHPRPQILMGDFNTPQSEGDGQLRTFGQSSDGSFQRHRKSMKPYTPERPYDARLWDRGERAVLEGLPNECGMADAFRRLHPDAFAATWVPSGLDEDRGRRFDHIYASSELRPLSVEHLDDWRRQGLSDHSAVEAVFELKTSED